MHNVVAPQLLLPFAAAAARHLGHPIAITWSGNTVIVSEAGLCTADIPAIDVADLVTVETADAAGQAVAQLTRAAPRAADWAYLNELAGRTYAPATEESRLKGAGSGLSDND